MKKIFILFLLCSKLYAQPYPVNTEPIPIEFDINKFPFNISNGPYWNNSSIMSTQSTLNNSFQLSGLIQDVEVSSNNFLGITIEREGCYRRSTHSITVVLGPTGLYENLEKLIDHSTQNTDLDTRRKMTIELLKLLNEQLKVNINPTLNLRNIENIVVSYTDTRIKNSAAISITFSFEILEKIKCPDSN